MTQEPLIAFDYKAVLQVLQDHQLRFLLIGGLNYFLAHQAVATQDIDIFIEDNLENNDICESALVELQAEWGKTDADWGPVSEKMPGWMESQSIYCMLTKHGPIDVFRTVPGIESFEQAWQRSVVLELSDSLRVRLLSAQDLLDCQLAIPEACRRLDRIVYLKKILQK
jgi:hypothetical protein